MLSWIWRIELHCVPLHDCACYELIWDPTSRWPAQKQEDEINWSYLTSKTTERIVLVNAIKDHKNLGNYMYHDLILQQLSNDIDRPPSITVDYTLSRSST